MTVNFLDRRHRLEAVKRNVLLYLYDPAGNVPACTSSARHYPLSTGEVKREK